MTTDTKRRHPMIRALPAPLSLPRLNVLDAAAVLVIVLVGTVYLAFGPLADARVYYEANLAPAAYVTSQLGEHGLMYSPAFVFWTTPLRLLPFPVFAGLILAAELAALAYLIGPRWAAVAVIASPAPLHDELQAANLNLVTAALVVLALSRPGWWAPLALSKVTPALGGLWHLFRGDWRAVLLAVGATVLLALPALILAPGLWIDWLALLADSTGRTGMPLWLRLPVAVGMLWYAARYDKPWLVPLAVVVALPITEAGLLVGLGAIRLWLRPQSPDTPRPR